MLFYFLVSENKHARNSCVTFSDPMQCNFLTCRHIWPIDRYRRSKHKNYCVIVTVAFEHSTVTFSQAQDISSAIKYPHLTVIFRKINMPEMDTTFVLQKLSYF